MTEENQNTQPAADTKLQEPKLQETVSKPAPASNPQSNAPQIIKKRGGIGFFTAFLMSGTAMVGGAYLSLLINARPDIAQSLKISQFLPKPTNSDVGANDLSAQVVALRADLKILQEEVKKAPNNQAETIGQNPATNNNPTNTINGAQPNNPAPVQQANLDPLKAQIDGLSGRLTAIETRLAALDPTGTGGAIIEGLQAEIATLKVNFDALNARVAQTPSPAITFAVMSLAEATNRSGGFMPEYSAVKAALPNVPEVGALEGLAVNGAPTRALLEKEFENLGANIIDPKKEEKKEGGFFGWLKSLFSNMVKVKVKETAPDPNAPSAIYERAKLKLIGGDLQGAITEIDTMAQKSPELTHWIAGAKNRLDLDTKIAALRGAIERGLNAPSLNVTPPAAQLAPPANQNNPTINTQTNAQPNNQIMGNGR